MFDLLDACGPPGAFVVDARARGFYTILVLAIAFTATASQKPCGYERLRSKN